MITNGIKPTRLWHFTGKKHFRYWLNDKLTARHNSHHEQRDRKELLQLVGLALAFTSGIAYSYGLFSPPKDLTTVIRPPGTCDTKPKKSCPKTGIPPPCSSVNEPFKPCADSKRK